MWKILNFSLHFNGGYKSGLLFKIVNRFIIHQLTNSQNSNNLLCQKDHKLDKSEEFYFDETLEKDMKFKEFMKWKNALSTIIFLRLKSQSSNDQAQQQIQNRSTTKVVEKIRIFVAAKQDFVSMELDGNKRPLHLMQSLHIVNSSLATLSLCLYLVYETKDTRECMNSIAMSTAGILGLVIYVYTIFKMANIYDLADRYEMTINSSKPIEL